MIYARHLALSQTQIPHPEVRSTGLDHFLRLFFGFHPLLLGLALLALLLALPCALFTSGIPWREMRRAWLFIGGFVFFFALLTFLTGRGGVEVYKQEHLIRRFAAFYHPGLAAGLHHRRAHFLRLSQLARVFSLASG